MNKPPLWKACIRPVILGLLISAALFFFVGLELLSGVVLILFLLDARARYAEALIYYLHPTRSLRVKLKTSWCGRGVLSACDPTYVDPYPLWILPDGFPRVFFTSKFWVNAFGLRKIKGM